MRGLRGSSPRSCGSASRIRQGLHWVLPLAVAGLLLWPIVRVADWADIFRRLGAADLRWLCIVFLLQFVSVVMRGWYLARLAQREQVLAMAGAAAAAEHLTMLLPGPAREVALVALVGRAGGLSLTHALKAAGAVRLLEMTTRAGVAAVLSAAVPVVPWARCCLAAFALSIFVVGLSVCIWPSSVVGGVRKAWQAASRRVGALRARQVSQFVDRLLVLRAPRFLRTVGPIVAAVWLARWIVESWGTYAAFRAVGAALPWHHAAYVKALQGCIAAVPIRPPADVGTGDAARMGLLCSLGWTLQDATNVSLATRAIGIVVRLVVGVAGVALVAGLGRGTSHQSISAGDG